MSIPALENVRGTYVEKGAKNIDALFIIIATAFHRHEKPFVLQFQIATIPQPRNQVSERLKFFIQDVAGPAMLPTHQW